MNQRKHVDETRSNDLCSKIFHDKIIISLNFSAIYPGTRLAATATFAQICLLHLPSRACLPSQTARELRGVSTYEEIKLTKVLLKRVLFT